MRPCISDNIHTSGSPINDNNLSENENDIAPPRINLTEKTANEANDKSQETEAHEKTLQNEEKSDDDYENETITVVTRHTSPTPPGSSLYVRTRRADMAKTFEKTINKNKKRPEMIDKEIQSDRLDDPTRSSRFGSTARASVSSWSYTPSNTNYTGYAGRYSTQYNRDVTNSPREKTPNRSPHRDIITKESNYSYTHNDNKDTLSLPENNIIAAGNPEITTTVSENSNNDNSELIINVNLKLKKAKSPLVDTSAELVSPEITITNCQLPPQAPKPEGATKAKKKVRKSSTNSSSDSSKKKVLKKRSKSISSTDSDQSHESNVKADSESPTKALSRNSSSNQLNNSKSKHSSSKSRESDSPESSITLSTQSSLSEDETISKSKNEPFRILADELVIALDKFNKQSSPHRESGTEEAKSFLIRTLAPVTNLFKIKQQDSSDNSKCLENSTSESTGNDVSNLITESDRSYKSKNSTDDIIVANNKTVVNLKGIKHIESGERAWWLDSESEHKTDNNSPKQIKHVKSGEKAWWLESNKESLNEKSHTESKDITDNSKPLTKSKYINLDKEEKPWWLDSSANIPEGIERLTPPRKESTDSDKSEKYDFYKVRRTDSEEKDWWLTSSENTSSNNAKEAQNSNLSKSNSDQRSFPLRRIRHIESGEMPWWLSSSKNIPEGIEKLPTPPPVADSDSSDSDEVQVYMPFKQPIPPFPLNLSDAEPLGDRKSPEGLENPNVNEDYVGRMSPYENAQQYRGSRNLAYQNKGVDKYEYISRYTDIDDILGTSGQIYSPFMDSILARRTGQMILDEECEEIDPTQVRIHDSTAQRPVIKKFGYR